jgi:hypothetical protein
MWCLSVWSFSLDNVEDRPTSGCCAMGRKIGINMPNAQKKKKNIAGRSVLFLSARMLYFHIFQRSMVFYINSRNCRDLLLRKRAIQPDSTLKFYVIFLTNSENFPTQQWAPYLLQHRQCTFLATETTIPFCLKGLMSARLIKWIRKSYPKHNTFTIKIKINYFPLYNMINFP